MSICIIIFFLHKFYLFLSQIYSECIGLTAYKNLNIEL